MAAPTYLFNSCDGSYEPLLVVFDPKKFGGGPSSVGMGGPEVIPNITIKIDDPIMGVFGCFNLFEPSELEGVDYKITNVYTTCEACSFSDIVNEFKTNPNISQKFEETRTEIQTVIQDKLGGVK